MIRKLGKTFNTIENNVLIISLAVMVIVIFMQVIMRYIFNHSLSWSEEFARYLFVWFSWMGVSAGLKDGEHLRVELLSVKLVKLGFLKADELVTILVSLIWLATTAIVTYYGFYLVSQQMDMSVLTPAMKMPVWIAYLSVPACSLVIGIRLIVKIVESIMKLLGRSNNESEVKS